MAEPTLKSDPAEDGCFTLAEFAELFQVSTRTVHDWIHKDVEPMPIRGWYRGTRNIPACFVDPHTAMPWIYQNLVKGKKTGEKERKDVAMAERLELANAERKKELLHVAQVQDIALKTAAVVAASLDAMPGRLAGTLANLSEPVAVRELLFKETREIRNAIARTWAELVEPAADSEDDGGTDTDAAKPKRKRMGGKGKGAPAGKRRAGAVAK